MSDFSNRSVLISDNGLFISLAERLVGEFGKVGYFCDWQSGFPDGHELGVGIGLEGITREKYFWPVFNQYDLIVFPDCWQGDLQEYLRSIGKRVWGAGTKSYLELARWRTRQDMAKIKIPVPECIEIQGMENLRAYLKSNDGVFVKISALRGLGETFESINYEQVKGQLDELQAKHGALVDLVTFVVEKGIPDARELGYDGYCIEGEFPNSAFYGAEVKDKAYFGKLVDYDDLPEELKETNTKLSYLMDGYRQFFSSELRNEFPIDFTCREASPAGEAFIQAMTNLPEVLWEGAAGNLVHAEWSAKYAAQILFCSEWAEEHLQPLQFPDEIRPFVKIYNHCRINGMDYAINQMAKMKQVGSVVGLGNTPDEACESAVERAKQIKGYDLEMEYEALDKAREEMEETESVQA